MVHDDHRGLRLDRGLSKRKVVGRDIQAAIFQLVQHVGMILEELLADDHIAVIVSGLVFGGDRPAAAFDAVQQAVSFLVHALEFDGIIRAVAARRLEEVQALIGKQLQIAVALPLELVGFQHEIAVIVEHDALAVEHQFAVVADDVAGLIRAVAADRGPAGIVRPDRFHDLLDLAVHGRVDIETAVVQHAVGFVLTQVQLAHQVFADLFDGAVGEVGRDPGIRHGVAAGIDMLPQSGGIRRFVLLVRDVALLVHRAQDELHTVDAGVVIIRDVFVVALDDVQRVRIVHVRRRDALDRRVRARQLRQRRKAGALDEVQILGILGEIRLRGSLDAAGIEAQVDRVQIGLDDLLLRQILLDDHRVVRFDDLTVHGAHALDVGQIQVSGQLLRDRGRTGDLRIVFQGVADGADDTDDVESVVIPERLVFDGDERVDQILRHLLVLQIGAQRIA